MKNILILLLVGFTLPALSQTGIGTTTPDPSAMLDVSSNDKGLLPPRMTEAERDAITSPADGLVIYQTDGSVGLYVRSSSTWVKLAASTSSSSGSANNNHSYVEFTNTGNLTNWIVPVGVNKLEINIAGSVGGSGGSIIHSANGSVYGGYGGGVAGFVSCLVYVSSGDTISYLLGNNGTTGNNLSCAGYTCFGRQADAGTDGDDSLIFHNSTEIIRVTGGKGGSGLGLSSIGNSVQVNNSIICSEAIIEDEAIINDKIFKS